MNTTTSGGMYRVELVTTAIVAVLPACTYRRYDAEAAMMYSVLGASRPA